VPPATPAGTRVFPVAFIQEGFMEAEITFAGFVVGLVSAAGLFIVNDQLTQALSARRFRRRVADDVRCMLAAYSRQFRDLVGMCRGIRAKIDQLGAGKHVFTAQYIWDDGSNPMDQIELQQNTMHLSDRERRRCVQFYSAIGRLGEIRKEYNATVTSAFQAGIHTTESREDFVKREKRYLYLLLGLLDDFQTQILEAVGHGSQAVRALSDRRSLRHYRRGYYATLAERLQRLRERAESRANELKLEITLARPPEQPPAAQNPDTPAPAP
jgi:hypothetical protein